MISTTNFSTLNYTTSNAIRNANSLSRHPHTSDKDIISIGDIPDFVKLSIEETTSNIFQQRPDI